MRKKSTRLLSAALAACMMLSVLPVGAFAAEPGTEPENTATAQEEAQTLNKNGDSITHGGTYTMEGGPYTGRITVNVQDDKDVIINITGSVTTSIEDMLIKVVKGHVTINGGNNVTVENTREEKGYSQGIGYVLIGLSSTDENTTVEINGGTYKRTIGAAVGCGYGSKGTLTIKSGTFETGMDGAVVNNAADSAAVMQIEGGTFIGRERDDNHPDAYALENYGTTIINGGDFQGYEDIVVYQGMGELQIHGGTFELMNPDGGDVIYIKNGPTKTTITGGDFRSLQGCQWGNVVNYESYMQGAEANELHITGGTFEIEGENVDGIRVNSYGSITIENATIKVKATSGRGAGIERRVGLETALKVKDVTIENAGSLRDFSDILLDNYRSGPVDFEITEDFTHKAVVNATDIEDGLHVTTKTNTHYQKDLKLVSAKSDYIIDYQKDGDGEYRYFNKRETDKYYVNPIHATMAFGGEEKRPYSQFAVGEKVTLTAFPAEEEGKRCTGWKVEKIIAAEPVTDVSNTGVITYDPENPETATLTVQDYDVFVTAVYGDEGEIVDPGTGGDAAGNIQGALSAVVVGAAAGAIIYEAGTGIYRVINMPGIPMPSNRIELAELLWEHAGKPEPVSTALYSDIEQGDTDAQKAAHWAVEQDLMKDDSEKNTFNPYFPVGKLRTCLTWNAAKEKGLFAKTEE